MKHKYFKLAKMSAFALISSLMVGSMPVYATEGGLFGIPQEEGIQNDENREGEVAGTQDAGVGAEEGIDNNTEPTQDDGDGITYSPDDTASSLQESSELNALNMELYQSFQSSMEEDPNGSRYTDDFAYYKVGGLSGQPSIKAPSAILMDAETGVVLYNKDSTTAKPPASITKIVTALVALKNGSLDDVITFSDNAVNKIDKDATMAGFSVGDEATLRDCLYGLFMASGADCAVAIAEKYGKGSVEEFVRMMNYEAQQLGCSNTNFVNPHGLHDPDHKTSAYDMALILQEAIKSNNFKEIIGTKSWTVKNSDKNKVVKEIKLQNKSALLSEGNKNYYKYAQGSKTGHTDAAKYTLASFADKDGQKLICVVLSEDSFDDSYADHKKLYEWGYEKTQVIRPFMDQQEVVDNIRASMTKEKAEKIMKLKPRYIPDYGILTNGAINKDALKTFFVMKEDMEKGIIGYLGVSYYDKTLIGETPVLYSTDGDEYKEYIESYNMSEDSVVITSNGGYDSENSNTDSYSGGMEDISGEEQLDDIDRFEDGQDPTPYSKSVVTIAFKGAVLYGMLMLIVCMGGYIIYLIKKKNGY